MRLLIDRYSLSGLLTPAYIYLFPMYSSHIAKAYNCHFTFFT